MEEITEEQEKGVDKRAFIDPQLFPFLSASLNLQGPNNFANGEYSNSVLPSCSRNISNPSSEAENEDSSQFSPKQKMKWRQNLDMDESTFPGSTQSPCNISESDDSVQQSSQSPWKTKVDSSPWKTKVDSSPWKTKVNSSQKTKVDSSQKTKVDSPQKTKADSPQKTKVESHQKTMVESPLKMVITNICTLTEDDVLAAEKPTEPTAPLEPSAPPYGQNHELDTSDGSATTSPYIPFDEPSPIASPGKIQDKVKSGKILDSGKRKKNDIDTDFCPGFPGLLSKKIWWVDDCELMIPANSKENSPTPNSHPSNVNNSPVTPRFNTVDSQVPHSTVTVNLVDTSSTAESSNYTVFNIAKVSNKIPNHLGNSIQNQDKSQAKCIETSEKIKMTVQDDYAKSVPRKTANAQSNKGGSIYTTSGVPEFISLPEPTYISDTQPYDLSTQHKKAKKSNKPRFHAGNSLYEVFNINPGKQNAPVKNTKSSSDAELRNECENSYCWHQPELYYMGGVLPTDLSRKNSSTEEKGDHPKKTAAETAPKTLTKACTDNPQTQMTKKNAPVQNTDLECEYLWQPSTPVDIPASPEASKTREESLDVIIIDRKSRDVIIIEPIKSNNQATVTTENIVTDKALPWKTCDLLPRDVLQVSSGEIREVAGLNVASVAVHIDGVKGLGGKCFLRVVDNKLMIYDVPLPPFILASLLGPPPGNRLLLKVRLPRKGRRKGLSISPQIGSPDDRPGHSFFLRLNPDQMPNIMTVLRKEESYFLNLLCGQEGDNSAEQTEESRIEKTTGTPQKTSPVLLVVPANSKNKLNPNSEFPTMTNSRESQKIREKQSRIVDITNEEDDDIIELDRISVSSTESYQSPIIDVVGDSPIFNSQNDSQDSASGDLMKRFPFQEKTPGTPTRFHPLPGSPDFDFVSRSGNGGFICSGARQEQLINTRLDMRAAPTTVHYIDTTDRIDKLKEKVDQHQRAVDLLRIAKRRKTDSE